LDLSEAVLEAVRRSNLQPVRGRIQTGRERFDYEIAREGEGGSYPTLTFEFADKFTGYLISEIKASIEEIHNEVKRRWRVMH